MPGTELYTHADLKKFEKMFPELGEIVFGALRGKILEREDKETDALAAGDGPPADQPAPTPTRGAKELAAEVGLDLRMVTRPTGNPDDNGRPKATQKDVERVLGN